MWQICINVVWSSKISRNSNSVFIFLFSFFYLTVCTIFTATFCRKPHWNSKDMSSGRMLKTIGNKDIFCFVCLYLKINISEFWLILLDHITMWCNQAKLVESHAYNIFTFLWAVWGILDGIFVGNPLKIGWLVPKRQTVEGFEKSIRKKGFFFV